MSAFNKFLTSLDLDPVACGSVVMPSTAKATTTTVKRRSCDECRTRKLACTKNPNGCDRCTRERLACHYSEQKPMGRPRKRQFVETLQDEQPVASDLTVESLNMGPLPFDITDFGFDYDYNDGGVAQPYYINEAPFASVPPTNTFDTNHTLDMENNDVLIDAAINVEGINNDSSNPSDSFLNAISMTTASNNSSDSGTSLPCSCLASMYLSLASLQQFPSDIAPALSVVRKAARTASHTIWCPNCGSTIIEQTMFTMDGFQNTMLLGTLLPIIAHGYHRLLKMIDDETDVAVATGQTKTFQFGEYGGICNKQETIDEALVCAEKEILFKAVEMPPLEWRRTLRALLRVDIHGHEQENCNHKGLKDLVGEVEQRQKARHEAVHQLNGNETNMGMFKGLKAIGDRTFTCLQILEIAKTSIDSLVIA
ncbi:hypothetical protein HYALB_00001036 [Hymenoscyphus albidus]|uniref:Zn(2)-C6 fungal-type domain-containing protein n=1 Tax=Hymenoscyphus albidus TaxID=595503 RepID=A0A9N9Q7G7_9HELO|nr:hypothetical protein HYALB_00001036 [Hymenoscyphus albidus]